MLLMLMIIGSVVDSSMYNILLLLLLNYLIIGDIAYPIVAVGCALKCVRHNELSLAADSYDNSCRQL